MIDTALADIPMSPGDQGTLRDLLTKQLTPYASDATPYLLSSVRFIDTALDDGDGPTLPVYPDHSLTDGEARAFYAHGELAMRNLNTALQEAGVSPQDRARIMFDTRNALRTKARDLMQDQGLADEFRVGERNMSWDEVVARYQSRGLEGDDLYDAIANAATRSRPSVNEMNNVDPDNPPELPDPASRYPQSNGSGGDSSNGDDSAGDTGYQNGTTDGSGQGNAGDSGDQGGTSGSGDTSGSTGGGADESGGSGSSGDSSGSGSNPQSGGTPAPDASGGSQPDPAPQPAEPNPQPGGSNPVSAAPEPPAQSAIPPMPSGPTPDGHAYEYQNCSPDNPEGGWQLVPVKEPPLAYQQDPQAYGRPESEEGGGGIGGAGDTDPDPVDGLIP